MPLFVKVIPLRAGASEPAGEPRLLGCPPDVEPDTILPFLTQRLGEPAETVWTSTEHHERLSIGWVFPAAPATGPQDAVELACIPIHRVPRRGAAAHVRSPSRPAAAFRPTGRQPRPGRDGHPAHPPCLSPPAGHGGQDRGALDARPSGPVSELDQALAAIADQAGATLHIYPRPGPAARRIVLRNERDDRGTRHLDAALDHDGILRITGHDQGPRVSDFWGEAITSYDWAYVIAADRIPALIKVLGGHDGDDVLALLAAHH